LSPVIAHVNPALAHHRRGGQCHLDVEYAMAQDKLCDNQTSVELYEEHMNKLEGIWTI
jgi:hypothetical protein